MPGRGTSSLSLEPPACFSPKPFHRAGSNVGGGLRQGLFYLLPRDVVSKFTVECPPYVYIAWERRFGVFVANQGLGHNKPLPVPFKQKNRQRFRKYINALPSRFYVRHSGRPCFNQIPKENPPHTSICLLLSNLRGVPCHAMTSSLSSSI